MKSVTATELRGNIYKLLDEVIETGMPIEIERKGKKVRIMSVEPVDRLKNLTVRDDVINGDPEDLVNISWEHEINLDFP